MSSQGMEMEKFPFFPIFCYDLKYWLRQTKIIGNSCSECEF